MAGSDWFVSVARVSRSFPASSYKLSVTDKVDNCSPQSVACAPILYLGVGFIRFRFFIKLKIELILYLGVGFIWFGLFCLCIVYILNELFRM